MNLTIRIFALFVIPLAAGCSQNAAPVSSATRPAPSPAATAMACGAQAFTRGHYAEATLQWQVAEAGYAAASNPAARCDALIDLAAARASLGRYAEAEQELRTALSLAGKTDATRRASIYCGLGSVCLATYRIDDADDAFDRAFKLVSSTSDEKLKEMVFDGIGRLRTSQQRFDQAAQAFEKCEDLARAGGSRAMEAQALANHARSAAWAGEEKTAFSLCRRGLDVVAQLPGGHEKARLLLSFGETASDLLSPGAEDRQARIDAAREAFHAAFALAQAAGDRRLLSYAYGYEGRLDEIVGQADAALALTRQATFTAQQTQAPEVLYRWQWQTARLLEEKGQTAAAIAEYSHAIDTVNSVRQDLALGYGNLGPHGSFRDTVGPLFYELADLLLQQSGKTADSAQAQALLVQARQTVELMKTAEIEDYFHDPCANILRSKSRTIENVDPGTAVLYLIPLADRTELLMGTSGGLHRVVVNVPAETLYAEVRQFRRGLEDRTTRRYMKSARRLYDWLIAPMEPELTARHIDTLVFVPDGVLRSVPMGALHDGSNFLISKYAIAFSPGLTVIDPRRISRPQVRVLEAGLSQTVRGYPALRFVSNELNFLRNLFPGVVLLDQRFITPNVKSELGKNQFTIVHIASHAESSSDVRKTFIVTYDSTMTIDDLQRLLRPTQDGDHPISLLTLSACQTASGDDRAALGLAGIALKAGARSTLATLWTVNDQAGSLLVGDFYESLHRDSTVSVAKALRHAQLKLLADLRYRHPGYWASYTIIGNWL